MPGSLWLDWQKASNGYDISETELHLFDVEEYRATAEEDFFLVPKDAQIVDYRPLDEFPGLFMEVADTEQTLEGVKGFANKFGLLRERPEGRIPDVMTIGDWYKFIGRMQRAVDVWTKARERGNIEPLIEGLSKLLLVGAGLHLRPTDDPLRAAVYLKPPELYSGIWAQYIVTVANNPQLRRCAQCPSWIVYGSGTGRRESAIYCSTACRRAAWKAKKESRK